MHRTNRQLIRIYFLLVLIMVLLGGWLGSQWTILDPDSLQTPDLAPNGDWIDLVASLGEQVIQLFLGLTSGS